MIKGIDWILCPTDSFDETTAFVRDVLGLTPGASGVPATDRQFTRYAQFTAPDRTTLEIVEPTPDARPPLSRPGGVPDGGRPGRRPSRARP
jgi:catechol 2,3-dioxygenase-like lactoylglutathione lyase family enzyme